MTWAPMTRPDDKHQPGAKRSGWMHWLGPHLEESRVLLSVRWKAPFHHRGHELFESPGIRAADDRFSMMGCLHDDVSLLRYDLQIIGDTPCIDQKGHHQQDHVVTLTETHLQGATEVSQDGQRADNSIAQVFPLGPRGGITAREPRRSALDEQVHGRLLRCATEQARGKPRQIEWCLRGDSPTHGW